MTDQPDWEVDSEKPTSTGQQPYFAVLEDVTHRESTVAVHKGGVVNLSVMGTVLSLRAECRIPVPAVGKLAAALAGHHGHGRWVRRGRVTP